MDERHIGSDFDAFLETEGMLDEVEAAATKRVIAHGIAEAMQRAGVSRSELARRMHTSRASVTRLLDPDNPAVTLSTLQRAARALGKRLDVRLTS